MEKIERIRSSQRISQILQSGEKFVAYPILIFSTSSPSSSSLIRAAFLVSKKNMKRAVDRNRIKRIMREAHRLQKHNYYQQVDHEQNCLDMVYLYIGQQNVAFHEIEEKTQLFFAKLVAH